MLEVSNSKIELNKEEKEEFKRVKERINSICTTAHKNNVRLFIDAEESWIQDAIDDIVISMMRKYNIKKQLYSTPYKCIVGTDWPS